jgi:hypothetical protein
VASVFDTGSRKGGGAVGFSATPTGAVTWPVWASYFRVLVTSQARSIRDKRKGYDQGETRHGSRRLAGNVIDNGKAHEVPLNILVDAI